MKNNKQALPKTTSIDEAFLYSQEVLCDYCAGKNPSKSGRSKKLLYEIGAFNNNKRKKKPEEKYIFLKAICRNEKSFIKHRKGDISDSIKDLGEDKFLTDLENDKETKYTDTFLNRWLPCLSKYTNCINKIQKKLYECDPEEISQMSSSEQSLTLLNDNGSSKKVNKKKKIVRFKEVENFEEFKVEHEELKTEDSLGLRYRQNLQNNIHRKSFSDLRKLGKTKKWEDEFYLLFCHHLIMKTNPTFRADILRELKIFPENFTCADYNQMVLESKSWLIEYENKTGAYIDFDYMKSRDLIYLNKNHKEELDLIKRNPFYYLLEK